MKQYKTILQEVLQNVNKFNQLDVPLPANGIKIGTIVTLSNTFDKFKIPDIKLQILKKVMAQSDNNTAKVFGIPNEHELMITNDDGVTVATIELHQILT